MMSEENPYAAPESGMVEPEAGGLVPPNPQNYATRGQRFAGHIIDTILLTVVSFGLGMLLALGGLDHLIPGQDVTGDADFLTILLGGSLEDVLVNSALGFVILLILQGYFWHTRSQSIGKIIMNTKIVTMKGEPANFVTIAGKRVFVMHLLHMIPIFGLLITLIDALMIFREGHNCLHDDIAGTRVISLNSISLTPSNDSPATI